MASVSLRRTQSSGNRQKWTYSAWIKRTGIGVLGSLIGSSSTNDDNGYGQIRFQADDTLNYTAWTGEWFTTNRKFRDPNAWYHVVVRVDTTQGNVSHRIRLYINGIEETSFSSSMNPSSGQNLSLNVNNYYVYLGAESYSSGTSRFFDGVISHIHFLDGEDRTPDYFGEFDANGVWKIKTSPTGINYGTNGFFILKDGNSVTDQSGNSNNFTVAGGTLTNTEDSPSNVFATFNPLAGYYNGSTFSNGNNTVVTGTTQYSYDRATLGASSGKYYWEIQYAGRSGGSIPYSLIGISSTQPKNTTDFLGKYSYDWAYYVTSSSKIMNASTETSYGTSYGDNDIIGVAMDLDNYKLYFSKNGTWQNSGDPTSGSTGTGAISIVNPSTASYGIDTPLGAYFPAVSFYDGGVSGTYKANFGNGYFGTTAVSSAGTNASGIGIFEYDVPTGFTALSTKGLNL